MLGTERYYKQVANSAIIETDRRNPRLRLSIFGYLTEAGFLPNQPEYFELVDKILEWVSADTEDYATLVRNLSPIDDELPVADIPVDLNGYEILKDKGPYL